MCHETDRTDSSNTEKTDSSNLLSTTNAIVPLVADTSSEKHIHKSDKLSNKRALLLIQTNIQKLENKVFNNSTDYQELIKLENCWKRINNELDVRATAQRERRSIPKKRSRSDSSQELSGLKEKGVDSSQELLGLQEVEVSRYATHNQTIVEQSKMLQQMLHQILDNQKLQNDFMKNDCKLDQVYNSVQKAVDNATSIDRTSAVVRTSALKTNNPPTHKDKEADYEKGFDWIGFNAPTANNPGKNLTKTKKPGPYKGTDYGIGASMLCNLGGGGGPVPKSLGKHGNGIESPVQVIRRENHDKSGIGTSRTSVPIDNSTIVNAPPTASITTNEFDTSFGKICFQNDADCCCYYKFILKANGDYHVFFGLYGMVLQMLLLYSMEW